MKNTFVLKLFELFCSNLGDAEGDLSYVRADIEHWLGEPDHLDVEEVVENLMYVENIIGWAWARLAVFAETLGPEFTRIVQAHFMVDPGAAESLKRDVVELTGKPPPEPSVN